MTFLRVVNNISKGLVANRSQWCCAINKACCIVQVGCGSTIAYSLAWSREDLTSQKSGL